MQSRFGYARVRSALNDWLENCSSPNAWLSLDEGDSHLGVFLTYFVAAVRTLFLSACAGTLQLLRAATLPPLARLVTALGNDLDWLADDPSPVAEGAPIPESVPDTSSDLLEAIPGTAKAGASSVVLDDCHLLKGGDVHTFLSELLAHPPRPLHLVISTRQEPPLPLHLFRAQGKMAEIRPRDLRFTEDEAAAFMERALGVRLGATVVATLAQRTEGWATGLRLAALSISAGANLIDPDVPVLTEDRDALDYLLNEVLDFRGCALYQMNDLTGAEAAFSEVVTRRYLAHGFPFSQSAFGVASIHLARGESERARDGGFGRRVRARDEQ